MTKPAILALAALPLALAACSMDGPGSAPASKVPAARVTGEALNCVPIVRLHESRIRDNRTIDFMTSARTGWRNTLPYDCPGLRSNDAFGYSTSLSELCSTDMIWVIEQAGGPHRGPSCGLGKFVPIELER